MLAREPGTNLDRTGLWEETIENKLSYPSMSHTASNDLVESVAVVGMSGRFPGARNLYQFWDNLRNGVESISFFTDEELISAGVDRSIVSSPNYVKAGGVIDDAEMFDAGFFGYSPREAAFMDPQHRIFLEHAWEALESAGYDSEQYQGSIGVFAGASENSYLSFNLSGGRAALVTGLPKILGNNIDFLATRVSYKLNLKGPSVVVQSSCSTSLVAVHLACESLLNYRCDMALAGGVSVNVPLKAGYLYQEGGTYSPDGHCRAFDANADGTVGGSGIGVVVLKRLSDAHADGDCIQAIIRGSAINNDGSDKIGFTAPSVSGQAEAIATAQAIADVDPETITYIETHGTGTNLGDPIEIEALAQVFRASTNKKAFCAIGSVKTNLGHLDAAAGVTGLIKSVLALKHKTLPPSLNFERPNPQIDFENGPFYVNTTAAFWECDSGPRRAGVSSFGMGGTNAHAILEEAPTRSSSPSSRPAHLIVLSANTGTALDAAAENLTRHLEAHPDADIADVAHTLQLGRHRFEHRRMLVCKDLPAATAALASNDPSKVFSRVEEGKDRPVAFLFPGQGSQHPGMGAELYRYEHTFREHVDRCCDLLKANLSVDPGLLIMAEHGDTQAAELLMQTETAQPALFVVEFALAQLWISWGIRPQAMIGHSIGEYVAACIAGVMSLNDALSLVATRGRLMQSASPGGMMAVTLSADALHAHLGSDLSIAAMNAPENCVVSGGETALTDLGKRLTAQGIDWRRLKTSHAFHSASMDPILDAFAEEVRATELQSPQIPFVSNVTGEWITDTEATDPDYWVRHLRQTVRFADGIATLCENPAHVLLEVGPTRTLSTLVTRNRSVHFDIPPISSLPHPQEGISDVTSVLGALGRLWLSGAVVDWKGFYAREDRLRVPLPTYPFERKRFWVEPQPDNHDTGGVRQPAGKKTDISDWFYIPGWRRSRPAVSDESALPGSSWLVLVDNCGLGTHLVDRLEQGGAEVITVTMGSEFAKITDRQYTLNPQSPDDYDALLKELRLAQRTPRRIVHSWSVDSDIEPRYSLETGTPTNAIDSNLAHNSRTKQATWFEDAQHRGFYSLVSLAKALGAEHQTERVHIYVVSNQLHDVIGQEVLRPEKMTVLAPCKVIPQEYPHVSCSSVDVTLPEDANPPSRQLIDQLFAEVTATPSEPVVAYRSCHRWVQCFDPVRLNGGDDRLRHQGVYLITGGLGHVGLSIANFLAQTCEARLVLTGRTGLPPREQWEGLLPTPDGSVTGDPPMQQSDQPPRNQEDVGDTKPILEVEVDDIARLEDTIATKLGIRDVKSYPGLEATLNELCSSYVYGYLQSSNVNLDKGSTYHTRELNKKLGISPKFDRLFAAMIAMLEEDEIIRVSGDVIEIRKEATQIEDAATLKEKALERYPGFKGLLDILDHSVSHYRSALTDEIKALSVLYPDGTADLLKRSQKETTEHTNARLYQSVLREIVRKLAQSAPSKRVKILEVGAGDGALTWPLAEALKSQNVDYYFTDITKAFVLDGRKKASERGLDFMKFAVLDISKDATKQGFGSQSFDCILGLDVVHATPSIHETTGYLRELLIPGGILLLVEAVKSRRWIDLITGLAEGWWSFNDERKVSPLLDLDEWEKALRKHEFSSVMAYPQDEPNRSETDYGLIIAQQIAQEQRPIAQTITGGDPKNGATSITHEDHRVRDTIRKVQRLEDLGSEVVIAQADVADAVQMRSVLAQIDERFGRLDGVIHAAGHTAAEGNALIQESSTDQCELHFIPKVYGLLVLDEVLEGRDLDFCLLLSSNVSVLGGLRSVAYTAANLFMDAFAQHRYRLGNRAWITTNWDRWGFLEELTEERGIDAGSSLFQFAMTSTQSADAFHRVLSFDGSAQVVVSTGDLQDRIEQWVNPKRLEGQVAEAAVDSSPLHSRPSLKTDYAAPRNAAEQILAEIWSDTLGIEQVGVHDNFFELGGDSIISIQVGARALQRGLKVTPHQIFECQTVAELAEVAIESEAAPVDRQSVTGDVELTPVQCWFFEQNMHDPHLFNVAVLLEGVGDSGRKVLTPSWVEKAATELVDHHDVLRLRYTEENGRITQLHADQSPLPFTHLDVSQMSEAEQASALRKAITDARSSLHLSEGPLFRIAFFERGSEKPPLVLWVIHHLVVDIFSLRILLDDFRTALGQLSRGDPIRLPNKTTAFRQWAQHLREHARSDGVMGELNYWVSLPWSQVAPADQRSSGLPLDNPAGSNTVASIRTVKVQLTAEETQALLREVPRAHGTETNDVLLTAVAQAVSEWTGKSAVLLDMEEHGREDVIEGLDLSRTVGWFTSIYPVVLSLGDRMEPHDVLKCVKQQLRQIPNRGMGYGLLRYLSADERVAEKLRSLPQPEVSFVYLGRIDQLVDESPFRVLPEPGGLVKSPQGNRQHVLQIAASVIDNRLQVEWTYSDNLHQRTTIYNLANTFLQSLQSVIAHCCDFVRREHEISDFPGAALSQEELQNLVSRLSHSMEINVPSRSIPEHSELPRLAARRRIRGVEDIYRLTPMQEGILFESLSRKNPTLYLIQLSYRLHGKLNHTAFRRALETIVFRHAVLRSSFHWEGLEKAHQVVHRAVDFPFELQDWRDRHKKDIAAALNTFLADDRQRGFQFDSAPLMRFTLLRLADDRHQFIWSFHHIILEGWSASLILKEMLALYETLCQSKEVRLVSPRPYRDYILWLQQQDSADVEQYWRKTLRGVTAPTRLNLGGNVNVRRKLDSEEFGVERINLSANVTAALQSLARQNRITVSTLVHGAWALLLSRYSGEQDIGFGSVVSGRTALPGAESMVGLFVNTLLARFQVPNEEFILPWLRGVHARLVEMRRYEHSPILAVQEWCNVPRGVPLFESLLVFENWLGNVSLADSGGMKVVDFDCFEGATGYPLTASATPGRRLSLTVSYDRGRFDDSCVIRLLGHWRQLLEGMAANPDGRLGDLPMLTEAERDQVLLEWNDTQRDYPRDQCVHQLFERQVERTPTAIAVISENEQVTYQDLNRRANRLAHHLCKLGVGPESPVGVCLQRNVDLVVGLLGILKAGGAYVPLDPEYPRERVDYMLADSDTPILLTQQELLARLPQHRGQVVCVDADAAEIAKQSVDNPSNRTTPQNLFDVLYTSGSTGQPNGVAIEHRSVAALLNWAGQVFSPQELAGVLGSTSICFDLSVFELFVPLTCGGTVILADNALALSNLSTAQRVTLINTVPSAITELLRNDGIPASVRTVNLAGEPLQTQLVREIYTKSAVKNVYDLYGPSEATTYSTFARRSPDGPATIGRPIANTQVYLLNDELEPVPVGVTGEVYIGGEGLARGYWKRPELTDAKFILNPHSRLAGARLYRTGDLARYFPDGSIEFLGRNDNQVKVRGFRIELGEIEAVLGQHASIHEAAVQPQEHSSGMRLVAYVVASGEQQEIGVRLRQFLTEKLPGYMVPSLFVSLEALPRTPNGKIDRQALLATDHAAIDSAGTFVNPRSPVEQVVADLYGKILGVEQVGALGNFFELGGHSLSAMRLVSALRDTLKVQLQIDALFERPTVAELSQELVALEAKPGQTEKIAQLVQQIGEMSAESVKEALREKRRPRF